MAAITTPHSSSLLNKELSVEARFSHIMAVNRILFDRAIKLLGLHQPDVNQNVNLTTLKTHIQMTSFLAKNNCLFRMQINV
jgi:aspartyl-tRNA synthetase